jgi:dihydroflavonol-4-reductase
MSRILVTGGTGFLGSALVPVLVAQGHKLRLLTRGVKLPAAAAGAEVIQGSLADTTILRRALKGVEVVYHLAGQVDFSPGNPTALFDLHVQGTRSLLELCEGAGIERLVLASTSGTIGISTTAREATEADDYPLTIAAGWPYYLSKIYQEKLVLRWHRERGLPVVILNPSLLLGPGDERLSSTHVVLKFMERRLPAMPGGGISFVDVRDAAAAFAAALTAGRLGERHLLGGANMAFGDFFARLSRITGVQAPRLRLPAAANMMGARLLERFHRWRDSEPPISAHEVEMGEHFFYVDSSRAQAELGFSPRDPQETLRDTVRDLRARLRGGVEAAGAAFGQAAPQGEEPPRRLRRTGRPAEGRASRRPSA